MTQTPQDNDDQKFITREKWLRLRKRLVLTIYTLTAGLGVSVYIILWQAGVFGFIPHKFDQGVKTGDAYSFIKKHRNTLVFREQSNVITYDTGTIRRYLDVTFKDLTSRVDNPDPRIYEWVVGFYPMHRYDENKRRLDFVIIPTLVTKDKKGIKDFFEDTLVYTLRRPGTITIGENDCKDCIAYDAGNIWP